MEFDWVIEPYCVDWATFFGVPVYHWYLTSPRSWDPTLTYRYQEFPPMYCANHCVTCGPVQRLATAPLLYASPSVPLVILHQYIVEPVTGGVTKVADVAPLIGVVSTPGLPWYH